MDFDLAPKWGLGVNLGGGIDEDDRNAFGFGLATAALSRDLTDRLRAFVELVLNGPEVQAGGHSLIFDGGLVYLLDNNNQLDVAFGTGLSGSTAADFFWTFGFSKRF
jgi:hypothetical protein